MRGFNTVHRCPYVPPNMPEEEKKPFICRLAPRPDGFEGEVLDHAFPDAAHVLYVRRRGSGEAYAAHPLTEPVFTVTGLANETEYEFYVESAAGFRSNTRLLRTTDLPEGATVINYLHPEDRQYEVSGRFLCSPSLTRLPDGTLVAGMDVYGPNMPQNLTILFSSVDDGRHWRYLTDLFPFYWSSLFVHRGRLYALGLTTEYGNLQIACSADGGHTWSAPTVLFYGSGFTCGNGGMHRAPMQLVSHGGRLWTTCEYGCWAKGSHLPAVLSIDENADLMRAENWCLTGFLPFEGAWREAAGGRQYDTMEGNVVLTPEGELRELLRWTHESMLVLKINGSEEPLSFEEIRPAPVSNSMFRVLPWRDGYLLVTNHKGRAAVCEEGVSYRSTLSVFFSKDLRSWTLLRDVVNRPEDDPRTIGFQYPCALLEGDTLNLSVRSAFNRADSFHNSNTILFWRLKL